MAGRYDGRFADPEQWSIGDSAVNADGVRMYVVPRLTLEHTNFPAPYEWSTKPFAPGFPMFSNTGNRAPLTYNYAPVRGAMDVGGQFLNGLMGAQPTQRRQMPSASQTNLMNLGGQFLGGMMGGQRSGNEVQQQPEKRRGLSNNIANTYARDAYYNSGAMNPYTDSWGMAPNPYGMLQMGIGQMYALPARIGNAFAAVNSANQQASQNNNALNGQMYLAQQQMQQDLYSQVMKQQLAQQLINGLMRGFGGGFGGGGGGYQGMTGFSGPNGQYAYLGG